MSLLGLGSNGVGLALKRLILLIFLDFSFYVIWAEFFSIGKLILNSLFNTKAIHVRAPYYDQCFLGGTNLVDLSTKYWGTFLFPSANLSNFTKFVGKKFANFLNKKLGREKKGKKKPD